MRIELRQSCPSSSTCHGPAVLQCLWLGSVRLEMVQVVGDAIEGFQLKRVRSGVETLLAANRISREIRGHVQSHGLTGIQVRHYDGHDYMLEKRQALELLAREIASKAARPKSAQRPRTPRVAKPHATR